MNRRIQEQVIIGNKVNCSVRIVDVETGKVIIFGRDYFQILPEEFYEERRYEFKTVSIYMRKALISGRDCEVYYFARSCRGKIKYKLTDDGRELGIETA